MVIRRISATYFNGRKFRLRIRPREKIPLRGVPARGMWILTSMLLLCLPFFLLGKASADGPVGNPNFMEFFTKISFNAQAMPLGAILKAYTPTGLLVGQCTVAYIDPDINRGECLIPVYGKDPSPQGLDGAHVGDRIAFTVSITQNNVLLTYPTFALPPPDPIWTSPQTLTPIELRSSALSGDFDGDCHLTVEDLMLQGRSQGTTNGQAGYYPPYDLNGDATIDVSDLRLVMGGWHNRCP